MSVETTEVGVWLELYETIRVHHEDVFAALTTGAGLTRWFPVSAEIDDLDAGGIMKLGWDQDMKRTTSVAILAFDPGGMVKWDWQPRFSEEHAPVTWTVTPELEEGARVTMRQGPFAETVEALKVMVSETETWRWYLCNLRTALESSIDMRRVRPL